MLIYTNIDVFFQITRFKLSVTKWALVGIGASLKDSASNLAKFLHEIQRLIPQLTEVCIFTFRFCQQGSCSGTLGSGCLKAGGYRHV